MSKVSDTIKKFKQDEKGATAIEYGLIATLISIVILASLGLNGDSLGSLYADVLLVITDAIAG